MRAVPVICRCPMHIWPLQLAVIAHCYEGKAGQHPGRKGLSDIKARLPISSHCRRPSLEDGRTTQPTLPGLNTNISFAPPEPCKPAWWRCRASDAAVSNSQPGNVLLAFCEWTGAIST